MSGVPRVTIRRHPGIVAGVVALHIMSGGCRGRIPPVTPPATADPPAAASPAPTPPAVPVRPDVMVVAPDGHAEAIARRVLELAAGASGRLAAGEVGYYMDVQQARLQQLGRDRVRVVREGTRLVVTLVAGSSFEHGGFRVTKDAEATLASLSETLREFDRTLVSVHGHTDASGSEAANLTLSERRALAVARFLVDHGVDRRRLIVVGRGQLNPVAPNETKEGRELNRRVEVHIDPLQIRGASPPRPVHKSHITNHKFLSHPSW